MHSTRADSVICQNRSTIGLLGMMEKVLEFVCWVYYCFGAWGWAGGLGVRGDFS